MDLLRIIVILAIIGVALFIIWQIVKWKVGNMDKEETADRVKYRASNIVANLKERIAEFKEKNK